MNYEEELARLSDTELDAMAGEPETAFPKELWKALTHVRAMRAMSLQQREALRRRDLPEEPCPDISAWAAVITVARTRQTAPQAVPEAIRGVIASDPLFKNLSQPDYPLDLYVSFPVEIGTGVDAIHGTEGMWVRAISPTAEPNHWIGRLLNKPNLFTLARRDGYIEFVATNRGLFFVRVGEPPDRASDPR